MSLSSVLPKIGMATAALFVTAVAVAGLGASATADEGDDGSTPPPTSTTCAPPAATNGHPWHNCHS